MMTQTVSPTTTQRINPHPASQEGLFDLHATNTPAWLREVRKPSAKRAAIAAEAPATPAFMAMHTGAPDLPSPTGDTAAPARVRRCVQSDTFPASSSMFAVLQTMTEGKQTDMILAQLVKRLRTQAQMLSKQRELNQKRDEIIASNTSASGKLVASGLATGLSGVAAWFLRYQDVGINQAITGAFDYWDRTFGGQCRANDAMLEQKHELIVGQLAQQQVDAASAWYEQVKDSRKNAQQSIMTHIQMVGDAVSSVWR